MIKKMVLTIGVMLFSANAVGETAQEKGLSIAQEGDRRNAGFLDNRSKAIMILKDRSGNTSQRQMRFKTLEGVGEDGDKSLIIFDTPKDQKGTALLTYSHPDRNDDQWLYLPALKRVKKIASKNRSGPFMGSEFAFEDMGSREVEKYTYKWLRDDVYNGEACFVVESYPKDKYSGYTRIVAWIDKVHYRNLKAEFYDRKRSHLKTLVASDYKQYEEKFWLADMLEMVNHQTGKSTQFINQDVVYKTGLKESDFNKNSLKRAR